MKCLVMCSQTMCKKSFAALTLSMFICLKICSSICEPVSASFKTCSTTALELYAWFKYNLRQKYHAPQVRLDWGSNSRPPDHDSTLHVTETPPLTTWHIQVFLAKEMRYNSVQTWIYSYKPLVLTK